MTRLSNRMPWRMSSRAPKTGVGATTSLPAQTIEEGLGVARGGRKHGHHSAGQSSLDVAASSAVVPDQAARIANALAAALVILVQYGPSSRSDLEATSRTVAASRTGSLAWSSISSSTSP